MAFKMKGSPIKLGKIQGTSGHASALKQQVENIEEGSGIVRLDETDYAKPEGSTIIPYSEEAKAAHDANIRRLSEMDLSQEEYDAELAKTRHLPDPNPVVVEEPTVYPRNPKDKKRRRGFRWPKITIRKAHASSQPGKRMINRNR
jgi:hypothetical protein